MLVKSSGFAFRLAFSSVLTLFAVLFGAPSAAAVGRTGAEIYRADCVRCHGPAGEGVAEKHDEPLNGDRSLESLSRIIQRTMPEDSDTRSTPEEAAKVAAYIYEAFYSPEARARINPPKIDFSRLTVPQYLNSVADLIGSFSEQRKITEERGLRAEYYNSRNFARDTRAIQRTDHRIQFDFGEESPGTEKFRLGLDEFSIKWTGSLLVDETGDYEFRLKSQNGARLYINDEKKPLIDAWVSSGPEVREHKETIRLLGGRAPFRVEFFKFKEKSASIIVEWKPPHKAWETIPVRHVTPSRANEVMVVSTPFPPDDGSAGYERGTTVSKAWDQASTRSAVEVATRVIEQLERLSGAKADQENRKDKVQQFAENFVERAFRRPLTPEDRELYIEAQFRDAKDVEAAVKRVVILALKSPRFLYPELPGHLEGDYLTATRLAMNLWDSLPDRQLLSAASKGELKTREQISAQVKRMLRDDRTRTKLSRFFHHWLEMEEAEDLSKDPAAYPDFTDHIIADLRTSLELFIHDVVWSERSDYRDLLKANYLYLNPRLAGFYGGKLPERSRETPREESAGDGEKLESENIATAETHDDETFYKVEFDPSQRVGVLTHPYLLSAFAYYKSSSPIHRGVFLTRNIIGRALKPPPAAIQFMDGRFDPKLTMREKVTELTSPAACMGCHSVINPLGFSLEHFDGVGRFRTVDNQKPVDAESDFMTPDGDTIRLKGARDVAEYAAGSVEAHRGFVRQMFQHLVKQPVAAYGPDRLERLRESFEKSEFNIQKLVAEIVTVSALREPAAPSEKNRVAKAD